MKKSFFKITDDGKLKTSELLQKCKDKFPVWCYLDDKELDKDFPKPEKATTRYFKKNVEADEDLKNKSAEDCEREGIDGITLRERILMELSYFEETGEHLDMDNWTLCSGSRGRDGGVPRAGWRGGFSVDAWGSSGSYLYLRPRRAFNSLPSNLESLESTLTPVGEAIEIVKKAGYKVIREY